MDRKNVYLMRMYADAHYALNVGFCGPSVQITQYQHDVIFFSVHLRSTIGPSVQITVIQLYKSCYLPQLLLNTLERRTHLGNDLWPDGDPDIIFTVAVPPLDSSGLHG